MNAFSKTSLFLFRKKLKHCRGSGKESEPQGMKVLTYLMSVPSDGLGSHCFTVWANFLKYDAENYRGFMQLI